MAPCRQVQLQPIRRITPCCVFIAHWSLAQERGSKRKRATQTCWAHAILMDSTPRVNSTVQGPDLDITLRYNVRVDGSRSRVMLVAEDGTSTPLTLAKQAKQAKPGVLQMHASGLKAGAYKLQWNVLASDGHMSKGEVPFTVK